MKFHRIAALALALALSLASAGAAFAADTRVDINTATVAELVALPGVGEALARRIVEYREKQGPFTAPEQLMNVRGIGEKSFEKLRDRLSVGSEAPKAKQG
jgi:competence protein ComEA